MSRASLAPIVARDEFETCFTRGADFSSIGIPHDCLTQTAGGETSWPFRIFTMFPSDFRTFSRRTKLSGS
jgi:hypothetical protein